MVIRSDIITESDIRRALTETRSEDHEDIYLDDEGIQSFKPRRKACGFKFYCESVSGRRARNGRPGKAASWDAYGLVFARLFKIDPSAYIAWYDGIEQFIDNTNRYQPRDAQAPWLADGELLDLAASQYRAADLQKLKADAQAGCQWRGHTLGPWEPDAYWKDTRHAECTKCGRGVWVDPSPAPNGIDIHGEAVALNCT
jgi:hypothetical protein